ncbi:MAG: dynamin family protein [Acidiferrobacteraceae bacterium]
MAEVIREYQSWIERHEGSNGPQGFRADDLLETLNADRLVIAVTGEYARGKTELLNAIFFADRGARLMPSAAGRTTMCPVELRYDEKLPPCVRLLPIETRKTALTLATYRQAPAQWTTRHILKPESAAEWQEAFSELARTKRVDALEAWELGLQLDDPRPEPGKEDALDQVEIPVWRHAIANYPHPLLRDGLVILDTPGHNAVGVEPELALAMLPDAHALLFLVAADAGVTKTDLGLWQSCSGNGRAGCLRMVVLNKVDILWDELRAPGTVADMIAQQVEKTAQMLDIEVNDVFPVSAQKALAAKVKGDLPLLDRSGLREIERRLADEVIPGRHLILQDQVLRTLNSRIEGSRALAESRLATQKQHLGELRSLHGKNRDVIHRMATDLRVQKRAYDGAAKDFEMARAGLAAKAAALLGCLNVDHVQRLTDQALMQMSGSWTTVGLRKGIEAFFAGVRLRMNRAGSEALAIRQLVDETYRRLHREYGLPDLQPPMLSLAPFAVELTRLERKAEAFRNSAAMWVTERHFVVNRFLITLAGETRQLFSACDDVSKRWLQDLISPLFVHIQQHKAGIDSRLADLKRIYGNMDRIDERVAAAETRLAELQEELRVLDDLFKRLSGQLD